MPHPRLDRPVGVALLVRPRALRLRAAVILKRVGHLRRQADRALCALQGCRVHGAGPRATGDGRRREAGRGGGAAVNPRGDPADPRRAHGAAGNSRCSAGTRSVSHTPLSLR